MERDPGGPAQPAVGGIALMAAVLADRAPNELHRHLDALASALQTGEIREAAHALDAFDATLRVWLPTLAADRRLDVLETLLDRQQALLACMHHKQEEAAAALRTLEQSRRAAGAYRASGPGTDP